MGCAQSGRQQAAVPQGGRQQIAIPQPVVAAAQSQVSVQIPPGARGGDTLEVNTPDGQKMRVQIPQGVGPGQIFTMQYAPRAGAAVAAVAGAGAPGVANTSSSALRSGHGGVQQGGAKSLDAGVAVEKFTNGGTAPVATAQGLQATAATAMGLMSKTLGDMSVRANGRLGKSTVLNDWKEKMTAQIDAALTNHDNATINRLLDSATAGHALGANAPGPLKRAAEQTASRQLRQAIESEVPKQIKGALVAARRLNATGVPEFSLAAEKYKELRKLPPGWDINKMVLQRQKDKMVSKSEVSDPAVIAKFQTLLDRTHRKVYTRDRMGQPVPERLELLRVKAIENDDSWSNYMVRREVIRRDIEADSKDFVQYQVETMAESEGLDAIVAGFAKEYGEALMPEVNEVFLFHGTNEAAAESITTGDFKVNLAGSNAGTLYGRGVYVAENASKSDEYTEATATGERQMLLCRVTLGRAYYTDAKDPDPRGCERTCLEGSFHSVLGDRKKCRGTFREFVVFDEDQVYPNYILTYRRVDGSADARRSMEVVCPPGYSAGMTLTVQAPDGTSVHVTPPPGVKPGSKFLVQY